MNAREELFRRVAGSFVDESRANALIDAFEAEIRKGIAADIRAAAPKYLDNDVDVHVWHVLDDLSNKVEHPDKDNA